MDKKEIPIKIKLPSIPIKESLSRLAGKLAITQRLPRVNLSPIRRRLPNLQSLIPNPRYLWPIAAVVILAAFTALALRLRPAAEAVAMPDELARLNLVAGQEVILWYSMDDTASDTLVQMVDEFNATNPWGITVVPQNQGTYARLRQRLDSVIERGAAPDMAALYPYHAAAYAAKGYVVALDPYLNQPELGLARADMADMLPGLLEGERNPQFNNQLLSFPIGPNATLLVYNLDWLRSIGYQDPPLTWGTFKEACKQAVADTNGDGAPDTFGYAFVPDATMFSAFVLTRDGQLISPDGRRALFNTLEGERAMRILRDTFSSRCAYEVPGRDWDRADFASAKVLFNIVPSSALPAYRAIIEQSSAFRWGVAPLPYTSKPLTPLHGQSWTIFKTTPERQLAAWLFVRWFAESRQTERWALATWTLPVRRSAVAALQNMQDLDPTLMRVLELATVGRPEPAVAGWDTVNKISVETMQAVAAGMDPKDALNQAEKAVNASLQGGAP